MTINYCVLKKETKSRIEKVNGKLICPRCRRPLKVGDEITTVPRKNVNGYNTRRYHKNCFEELYFNG